MSLVSTCQSDIHKFLDIVQEAFSGKEEHRDKYECETHLRMREKLESSLRKKYHVHSEQQKQQIHKGSLDVVQQEIPESLKSQVCLCKEGTYIDI